MPGADALVRGNRRPGNDFRSRAALAALSLFWIGALVGGALAPGYSARTDYVSSLAGRGSEVALLGVAALAVLAIAHLLAAATVRGAVRVPLALAGLSGLVVAAFRTGCPLGAAGCGSGANDTVPDLADMVHPLGVVAYEAALVAAMVLVVIGALRGGRPGWALLTGVAAVASVVLLLQTGGEANGWWQRGWLVVNTGWLAALVTVVSGNRRQGNDFRARGVSRPPRGRWAPRSG